MFNAEKVKNECAQWIRDFFEKNGKDCNAVVGISGGKDSSVAAALCCHALGKERVIGVMMPDGEQADIDYSIDLCNFLDRALAANLHHVTETAVSAGNIHIRNLSLEVE